MIRATRFLLLLWLHVAIVPAVSAAPDPLPSWNDTATKQQIIQFVEQTAESNSPQFVPVPERIAVFDNDGTLWAEQPAYFQLLYAVDQVKAQADKHPEWKTEEPFAAILKGDMEGVKKSGMAGVMKLVMATHANMTTDEFSQRVDQWMKTAKHPVTNKLFTDMVYQPMLELLNYLRSQGYKTYIVSGGGVEFMRTWAPEVYGIPPEQIIGSTIKIEYKLVEGKPVLTRLPEMDFIDDKEGKPVNIQKIIGRRPVIAAGNSDGDLAMLQWTKAGAGPRMAVLVHHTDAEREWAYDKESAVGRLEKALPVAAKEQWIVIDMKQDWKRVFPESTSD
ncbi:haloacid dehalogenase-like hydrolase [Photobacterium sp. GJ3]|uniref:HAD family hydrolase n=1 Tax=Photobacterium sp. GJ3 TaxID=2829502 RepID=UPI001B8D82CA|nr:HAD family hydrolase [Photobacterium sp. GJ3]QUJ68344.1 haloacid dehalogenase-like hydrolase [Photobacterium sp. GJ3]